MRIVLFFALALAGSALLVAGVYFTAPFWMPAIQDTQGHINQSALLSIMIVLPAAMAMMISALVNGVASLLSQKEQRAANLALETHKGEIIGELDEKRNAMQRLANEGLESHKGKIIGELDEKRNTMTTELEQMKLTEQRAANLVLESHKGKIIEDLDHKRNMLTEELETKKNAHVRSLEEYRNALGIKRAAIDDAVERVKEARETMTLYRVGVATLRAGSYALDDVKPFHPKLALCRDRLDRSSELYAAWNSFIELGHFLEERAEGLKPMGQRRLWKEASPKHGGYPLGVVFADRGEKVLFLLDQELSRIRGGH